MTVSTTCRGCGVEITGADEEDLISKVQAHLAEAHPGGHSPSREQVRSVLRTRAGQQS